MSINKIGGIALIASAIFACSSIAYSYDYKLYIKTGNLPCQDAYKFNVSSTNCTSPGSVSAADLCFSPKADGVSLSTSCNYDVSMDVDASGLSSVYSSTPLTLTGSDLESQRVDEYGLSFQTNGTDSDGKTIITADNDASGIISKRYTANITNNCGSSTVFSVKIPSGCEYPPVGGTELTSEIYNFTGSAADSIVLNNLCQYQIYPQANPAAIFIISADATESSIDLVYGGSPCAMTSSTPNY